MKRKNITFCRIYYDINKSKGNTFEKNINTINNIYFGQGINLTDNPYIILNEKDHNKYFSLRRFAIKNDKNTMIKEIFVPGSFLQPVFYYENLLLHLTNEKKLIVVKLGEKSYEIITFQDKSEENHETIEDETKVNAIKIKLKNLNNIVELSRKYEILIDIFKEELKCSLKHTSPKNITKNFEIILDKNNYIIEIETLFDTQIDDFGILREKIKLCKKKISLKDGIKFLKSYRNNKKDGEKKETYFTSNDFNCPIIYKNFLDEVILEDSAVLFEIKSGFALKDVVEQLGTRIKNLNNCFFIDNKKRPIFYIGLVNINIENN